MSVRADYLFAVALSLALVGCGDAPQDRRDQATLNSGLHAVMVSELSEIYRTLPLDEPFSVKALWMGAKGKTCGLASYSTGDAVRFIETADDGSSFAIKGREGWSDDLWMTECNEPIYTLMKP